ncbi:MAG: hypothetical protein HY554_12585, partial [Elusimicrobia bacterium]|nr:hypothetical protein [Elusimicrobiota bacterium]
MGKSLGAAIPFVIAGLFGVARETDLFFFAYSVVHYLAVVVGEIPRLTLGPFIAEKLHDEE